MDLSRVGDFDNNRNVFFDICHGRESEIMKRIATFAIDETSVEESDNSWKRMFYKQLQIPILLAAWMFSALYLFLDSVPEVTIYAGLLFLLYSLWPAIGAYWYWRIE